MTAKPMPQTLARIGGLSPLPSHPASSVLLMIDPQREYTTGLLPLHGIDAAVEEGARLLAFARVAGMPVIHVLHRSRPGAAVFAPDSDGARFIPELEPVAGETALVKSLPNAFAGTELTTHIHATGRTEIVIAGFATHMCVSATARSALDHGFRSTVVAGATATRDLPHPFGAGVTSAEIILAGTLAALSDRFSVVIQDTAALSRPSGQAA
ncbi:MAG: cysteine hydrolase family protein [Pseudomonadota bacterium]